MESYEMTANMRSSGILRVDKWGTLMMDKGDLLLQRKAIRPRPHLQEFIENCLRSFSVAIWTCMNKRNAEEVLRAIFKKEIMKSISFVYDQRHCTKLDMTKGKERRPVFLKESKKLWKDHPFYSPRDTIFVDDSPYKMAANPPYCALYPSSYVGSLEDDFLRTILWPYLRRLMHVRDIRCFLKLNEPRWSTFNRIKDNAISLPIYSHVRATILKFKQYPEPSPLPLHKFSTEEIPIETRVYLQNMGDVRTMSVDDLFRHALKLGYKILDLDKNLEGHQDSVREHLWKDQTIHGLPWAHEDLCNASKCNRDMTIDEQGTKRTCTNPKCVSCPRLPPLEIDKYPVPAGNHGFADFYK